MKLFEAKSIKEYLDSKPGMSKEDRNLTSEILSPHKDIIERPRLLPLRERYDRLAILEDMIPMHLIVKKAIRDKKEKEAIGTQMILFN